MPETAILNPLRGFDPSVGGSMNPDFSFKRSRSNTRLVKKPTGGSPYSRDITNTGHSFNLQWSNRPGSVMRRIVQFAEQYEDGYFTIYDFEDSPRSPTGFPGQPRAYTGRFTGDVTPSPTANDCWLIQATFEEMPTAPMLVYPNDWQNRSIVRYVNDDFGNIKTASLVAATAGTTNAVWTLTPRPTLLRNAGAASPPQSLDTPGAAGDWAAYQYRGYGFQLSLLHGADCGQVTISLDGNLLNNPHPLAGEAATVFDLYTANPVLMPEIVLTWPNVPLDLHVVQVTALGTKNAASTGTDVRWWSLQVMR